MARKLTDEQVQEIVERLKERNRLRSMDDRGDSITAIAAEYGVSRATIQKIEQGRSYVALTGGSIAARGNLR